MVSEVDLAQIDTNAKSTFKSDYTDCSSVYDHIYISESDTTEFLTGQSRVSDAMKLVDSSNSISNMK